MTSSGTSKRYQKKFPNPSRRRIVFRSFTHKLNTLPFLCDSYPLFSLPSDGGQNYADLRPACLTITLTDCPQRSFNF